MKRKILQQGAEAIIYKKDDYIIKHRINKSYRLSEIDDKIRKLRTRSEAKIMQKINKIIPTPKIIKVDEKTKEIIMEFLPGKRLSEHLDLLSKKEHQKISQQIGENIAKIHNENIIHGDLTTSNMIYSKNEKFISHEPNSEENRKKPGVVISHEPNSEENRKKPGVVFIIDLGLAFHSNRIEDKAVDLHLLKQALEAKHFKYFSKIWKTIEQSYKKNSKEAIKILERLKQVESRGRYKERY